MFLGFEMGSGIINNPYRIWWLLWNKPPQVMRKELEEGCPAIRREMDEMMDCIYERHGTPFREKNAQARQPKVEGFAPYEPIFDEDEEYPHVMPDDMDCGEEGFNSPTDAFISAEALLAQGEEGRAGKIAGRAKDEDGNFIGHHNPDPILSTLMHEAEFPDGQIKPYAASIIAQAIRDSCDGNGVRWSFTKSIAGHRIDDEAAGPSHRYPARSSNGYCKKATRGVGLQCGLGDGSAQPLPLKELKEPGPAAAALYAQKHSLLNAPAFKWWAPYALKKKKAIERAIAARARASKLKLGIEAPSSAEHARELGAKGKAGSMLWAKAIGKEMAAAMAAFEILEKDEPLPKGFAKAEGCLALGTKLGFARKARWVGAARRAAACSMELARGLAL